MRRPDGDSSKDFSFISEIVYNGEACRYDWLNPTNNTSTVVNPRPKYSVGKCFKIEQKPSTNVVAKNLR